MAVFMVERSLKGIAIDALAGAQQAAIRTASEMTAEGTKVNYIRTTFSPEDGRCFCLFDAADAAPVKALQQRAGLPFDRIVPAMDLTPR